MLKHFYLLSFIFIADSAAGLFLRFALCPGRESLLEVLHHRHPVLVEGRQVRDRREAAEGRSTLPTSRRHHHDDRAQQRRSHATKSRLRPAGRLHVRALHVPNRSELDDCYVWQPRKDLCPRMVETALRNFR